MISFWKRFWKGVWIVIKQMGSVRGVIALVLVWLIISGTYSGSNITYTTATAQTFYVGRIWRVKR